MAEYAFARYPQVAEGELSKIRASVVNGTTLAEVAAELGLGSRLRLGKGEESIGGREKRSILADAMEAVIGAVYLDGGMNEARELVLELLTDRISDAAAAPDVADYKSRLQEAAAHDLDAIPSYECRGEGPDHDKRFFAEVRLGRDVVGRGEGRNKKEAEQEAARAAWTVLFGSGPSGRERESGPSGRERESGPSGREREHSTNAGGTSDGDDHAPVVDLAGEAERA